VADDYVLELTDTELARYVFMAQRARADEQDLWDRAGIAPGATVADIGCGPGAVSAEMADVVGPTGRVIAVDGTASTVEKARRVCADRANVETRCADATDTGIAPGSVDTAVIRHVLAHNGGREQAIVDHATSLLRPGGHLYVVDVDLTAQQFDPPQPDISDLRTRYVELHRRRGNDPAIGLRLGRLLRDAGLTDVDHSGRYVIFPATAEMRPPSWIARDAIVEAGLATAEDVARWAAAFDTLDAAPERPTVFVAQFAALGRAV